MFRLEAENLRVAYDRVQALEINELRAEGRVVGLIGHNGSGKSTLIKTILELLMPREGTLSVLNNEGKKLLPEKHMAFSPETGAVFSDMKVEDYFKLWGRIKLGNAKHYLERGAKYLELMEADKLLGKKGGALSKGERRRVQTSIGLMIEPELFLFDEPFDGLDIRQASSLADVLVNTRPEMGMIVSSHQMSVIERLSDTIIVLNEGKVVSYGSAETVSREISGSSAAVYLPNNVEQLEVLAELKTNFPSLMAQPQGKSISLTGHSLQLKEISSFCLERLPEGVRVGEVPTELDNAMAYFLSNQ